MYEKSFLQVKKEYFGKGLQPIDLLILSQVEEFNRNGKECYMTNQQFSNDFGATLYAIKTSIDKLAKEGYIQRSSSYVDGKGRGNKQRIIKRTNKMVGCQSTFQSGMEGCPSTDHYIMEGRLSTDQSGMEGRLSTFHCEDKQMEGRLSTDHYADGRLNPEQWKVDHRPIKDNLKENLSKRKENVHPSGSLEHPSDAECPTDTAPPKAGLEPAKEKDKNRRRMPNELAIQEKREIAEGYREGTMEYPDMYDRYNVKKGTLNYEKIVEFESEIAEYDKNKEKKVIISQLESQPDKLAKLSEYSGCSIEEVKENVSKFKLNPDMLIDCFKGDSGYIYKRDYWLEKYKNQHTYWDWVSKCYDLQYHASLGSGSVVGSSSYSAKTEDFDDVIDDADSVANSVEDADYNNMTNEQFSEWLDSWL